MDFHQNTQPEAQTENPIVPNQPVPDEIAPEQNSDFETVPAIQQSTGEPSTETAPQGSTPSNTTDGMPPYQNVPPYGTNGQSYPNNQPYSDGRQTYQNNQPYGDGRQPYQNNQPYGNGRQPYQNNQPYSDGRQPYQNNQTYGNGMPPYGNNGYQQNEYPYYNRNAYQLPPKEPGSGFATAAMVLGIISIVSCFTFTVYPAFVAGSVAIVLALLSKGRQAKLLSKARGGIICGIAGLMLNTVLVISCMVLLFTNPEVRAEVNETFEKQYGVSFDEMMEEIMEENGLSQ